MNGVEQAALYAAIVWAIYDLPAFEHTTKEATLTEHKERLFELGQIGATPGALDLLERWEVPAIRLLARHVCGDWGEVGDQDAAENAYSVCRELRILSAYTVGDDGDKVWIITEADRSATTILLPEDY